MKRFINKILDVPKLIRTIWLMLWIILIILLVLKFCFNQWYPIIVENEWFKRLCDYIDNNRWLYYTIALILYIVSINIISLTCMNKKKYDNEIWLIIINVLIIGNFFIKYFNATLGNVTELILLILPFIIINLKQNNFNNKIFNVIFPIIEYIILNLWQFTILIIRGTDEFVLDKMPMLIPLILQIDYYIFITITWIGVSFMGLFSMGWFWTKDITVLKAERQKELSKAKPDMKKVEEIDKRISEIEKGIN